MEMGAGEFGSKAIFCVPLIPILVVIPGPLIKKPNTSLNSLPTNSLYSSDANTYWNDILLVLDTISNDTTLAS